MNMKYQDGPFKFLMGKLRMVPYGSYSLTLAERIGLALARHTIFGRGKSRSAFIEPLFFHARKQRDAEIWNGRGRLRLPVFSLLKYLIMDRKYDERERAFLQRELRPGDTVVDIGANIGFYTLWFATSGVPNIHILAIEPNPEMHRALKDNIQINDLQNVDTAMVAIGDREAVALLNFSEKYPGSGSLLGTESKQIEVRLTTLSSLLEEYKLTRVDVVKIDVEGYEYKALIPFLTGRSVAEWPRVFLIEANDRATGWEGDLIGFIENAGYEIALRTRGNIGLRRQEACPKRMPVEKVRA